MKREEAKRRAELYWALGEGKAIMTQSIENRQEKEIVPKNNKI